MCLSETVLASLESLGLRDPEPRNGQSPKCCPFVNYVRSVIADANYCELFFREIIGNVSLISSN